MKPGHDDDLDVRAEVAVRFTNVVVHDKPGIRRTLPTLIGRVSRLAELGLDPPGRPYLVGGVRLRCVARSPEPGFGAGRLEQLDRVA